MGSTRQQSVSPAIVLSSEPPHRLPPQRRRDLHLPLLYPHDPVAFLPVSGLTWVKLTGALLVVVGALQAFPVLSRPIRVPRFPHVLERQARRTSIVNCTSSGNLTLTRNPHPSLLNPTIVCQQHAWSLRRLPVAIIMGDGNASSNKRSCQGSNEA